MVGRLVVVVMLAGLLAGCSDVAENLADTPSATTPAPSGSTLKPSPKPAPSTPVPTTPRPTTATAVQMGIPAIGVSGLRVVAYAGTADDRPGTEIQNTRAAASPRGPKGGVGPGEVGNFIVTAHRTTHGRPFGKVPELQNGDHILVTAGGLVYDYQVVQTMTISFRQPAEIAQQNAAVPGRPGEVPTRSMITLSTCRTPEDHAEGNYWKDALNNPEHRINKIGVLVATRPA
jgi:sortase A